MPCGLCARMIKHLHTTSAIERITCQKGGSGMSQPLLKGPALYRRLGNSSESSRARALAWRLLHLVAPVEHGPTHEEPLAHGPQGPSSPHMCADEGGEG